MSFTQDLLNLDFASLRTLRLVYRLGSFSAAADEIEVKQSTVSYTIDRVRKVVNDPLFLRQGGKVVPTSRCEQIIPIVENILSQAEALATDTKFDPADWTGKVSIISSVLMASLLSPSIVRRLQKEAPNLHIITRSGFLDYNRELLEGSADVALFAGNTAANGVYAQSLMNEYDVMVMDPSNPLATGPLDVDRLLAAKFVTLRPFPQFKQPHVLVAEKIGLELNSPITVSSPSEMLEVIQGSDLICGASTRYVQRFGSRLKVRNFPYRREMLNLHMFWAATSHRSSAMIWLRQIIKEEAERQGPPVSFPD